MCAINGFNFKDDHLLKKMSSMTYSRGPDNEGFFSSNKFSLAHNRLAIIDPTPKSNQPYYYEELVLSFNGEIYNYKDLRKKLESRGHNFLTNSDTEVVIRLFKEYGINSFKLLTGIFSIAIYDKQKDTLYLSRDIVGVKPLYYHFDTLKKNFFFSSLIKSLLLSVTSRSINENSILSYSNFNRNDLRETYFKNIFKLLPGEILIFDNKKKEISRFQLLKFKFEYNFSKKGLRNNIRDIFSDQFVSDVPIALSLSGGIDSNLIFSELIKSKNNSFNCYSVFFSNSEKFSKDFKIAEGVCKKSNINLIPVEVSAKDFINYSEKVVNIVEEPVGNTNSISNYILSKKVGEKVLFSGDGGDEIFTGYNRYKSIYLINLLNKFNPFSFLNIKSSIKNLDRFFIKNSRDMYLTFSEQNLFKSQTNVYKNFRFLNDKDLNELLNHSKSYNKNKLSNVMFHDLDTWIPNDILLRNDKIYAHSGIEVRVPFLDKKIIEKYLMINEFNKYGLFFNYKHMITNEFKELQSISKIKLGFGSPFTSWLRKEIYDYAKSILSKDYYDSSELLNLNNCQNLLDAHKKKYFDPYLLWNLINLQIFLREYRL
tara:strand:- start:1277 stop:3061 length:1785 start_codon:yes stop_codon:yes gene_type:complete